MNIVEYFKENQERFITLFGFAMVFVFGFFSGYYYLLDQVDKRGVAIVEPSADCADLFNNGVAADAAGNVGNAAKPDSIVASADTEVKSYVASKNSKVFHRPECSFAAKIKEENKIWFSSIKEAESSGLKPHSCLDGP